MDEYDLLALLRELRWQHGETIPTAALVAALEPNIPTLPDDFMDCED